VLGCSVGGGATTAVITGPGVLSHELVHGLRRQYDLHTQAMFEEGFAELINGSDAYPRTIALDQGQLDDTRQPELMVQLGPAAFRDPKRYGSATQFLDFVATEHGLDAVADFMREGVDDSAEAATVRFGAHFGRSLAEQAQAWRDGGADPSSRGQACSEGATTLTQSERVVRATVDCDAAETMGLAGAGEEAWVRQCLRLAHDARYSMTLDAQSGEVTWTAVPGTCDADTSGASTWPARIEAGQSRSFDMGACTWAVTFRSTTGAPEDFALTLRAE
ncbi:MAG: hypothetical protein KDK70_41885, partial [Myxococcales bacterium]|nr:hypothetical protein [Myxococcales bacterium]